MKGCGKKLIVLRGVPGSGKSTVAQKLMTESVNMGYMSATICSADDYFYRPDGVYDWNPTKLKNAHRWCFEKAKEEMKGTDCLGSTDLIIVDNTNIKKSHYQKYLDLATEYGYEVEEHIVGEFSEDAALAYFERNTHGVPLSVIVKMMEDFER